MQQELVRYYCVSPEHLERSDDLTDKLTVHDGQWAFCPLNTRLGGHDWRPRGSLSPAVLAARSGPAVRRAAKVR